ncbi:unnamed protein product [Echinostoma caproni]|uniref:RBD domain-containing protein n=1 Tax=Echinostoma caproni TaxID=27848 RepID=A0A183A2R5_9TREM|nr:unnamed protein product [Echinostoma caproni]
MTQGISTFRFPADTALSAVLERAAQRRQLPQHGGYQYHLESWPHVTEQRTPPLQRHNSQSEQQQQSLGGQKKTPDSSEGPPRRGQRLDLNMRLSEVVAAHLPLRFVLVRDNSKLLA